MSRMRMDGSGLLQKPASRRMAAGGVALCCMALTFLLLKPSFLNNDDVNIYYVLAGYRTGTPYPSHRFINVLLGLGVSGLYTLLPAVPWWAVYELCMLWLSLTVVNNSLFRLAGRNGFPAWAAVLCAFVLYGTGFVYAVVRVSFTLTAAMLGTAAAALILSFDRAHDNAQRTAAVALLLVALCFLTRNSAGYSLLCFVLAAVFYQLLIAPREKKLAAVGFGVAVCALSALLVLVNNLGILRLNTKEYVAFESARGRYMDYPHISYADDPAFFQSLGWDETVYALAENACYLDGAITAEAMTAVSDRSLGTAQTLPGKLMDTLQCGVALFRGSGVSQYMLAVTAALFACCVCCYLFGRRGGKAFLTACLVAAGAFLLCCYLCWTGRFPVRTFQMIDLPAATLVALLALPLYGENRAAIVAGKCAQRWLLGVAVCAAVLWGFGNSAVWLAENEPETHADRAATAEAYAASHPENVYLTDAGSLIGLSLFTAYPEAADRPVNLVDWGGTGMHSSWKELQLAENGISDFSGAMFRRDNVYFMIGETDLYKLDALLAYLTAHEDALDYTPVETLPHGVAVYRFQFAEGGAGE